MNYDLLIPVAPKDSNKIDFTIRSAIQYLVPKPQTIYIVGQFNNSAGKVDNIPICVMNEQEVMPLDPTACNKFRRPQWIYQQFIKLFQDITQENYLVVDSDLIFNREFHLFGPSPYFFLGNDQNHPPYFRFTQDFLGFGREYPHSFISEIMLFNKLICLEIAEKVNGYVKLYELCAEVISDDGTYLLGDYEVYGNYVYKYYPGLYDIIKIKTQLYGKYSKWTNTEIEQLIKDMADEDLDTFTIHTWI